MGLMESTLTKGPICQLSANWDGFSVQEMIKIQSVAMNCIFLMAVSMKWLIQVNKFPASSIKIARERIYNAGIWW
jgi:S-adenosylhomocysteine hydrolase